MTGFSQPERRGLQQMQSRPDVHPDADLLTAFAEQALTSREREQVLSHLAVCSVCRNVVSLAAPPQLVATQPASESQPSFWRWPMLRWGAALATAVVVVSVVAIHNLENGQSQKTSMAGAKVENYTYRPPETAQQAASEKRASDESLKTVQPAAPGGLVAGIKRPQIRYEKTESSVAQATKERDDVALLSPVGIPSTDKDLGKKNEAVAIQGRSMNVMVGGAAAGNYAAPVESSPSRENVLAMGKTSPRPDMMADAKIAPAAVPAPPPPPPSASSEEVTVSAESALVETQKPIVNEPAAKGNVFEYSRAKAAVAPQRQEEVGDSFTYRVRPDEIASLNRGINLPQWQVTREGFLQKSLDRGQSWLRALPSSGFRAVAFIKNEVWAGGLQGILMHSTDNGQNWHMVTPKSKDQAMHGDITSITFVDSMHGTITTSEGETWITLNGGNSWHKK